MLRTCAMFSDCVCVCVYRRYVLKWFMSSTCDKCEIVPTYSGLGHLILCYLETNVQPHWLVTSTLQCIPLLHKMCGYEGIISNSLAVCWFLISLPFSSTEVILQCTIH